MQDEFCECNVYQERGKINAMLRIHDKSVNILNPLYNHAHFNHILVCVTHFLGNHPF